MLLPCRLKTRISTASSATNMRPSAAEYPTSGWVNFQSATLGQFCIGTNSVALIVVQIDDVEDARRIRTKPADDIDAEATVGNFVNPGSEFCNEQRRVRVKDVDR